MIGGKWLTEINVTSPTGIVAIDKFNGTDTPALIWDAIERRLDELIQNGAKFALDAAQTIHPKRLFSIRFTAVV